MRKSNIASLAVPCVHLVWICVEDVCWSWSFTLLYNIDAIKELQIFLFFAFNLEWILGKMHVAYRLRVWMCVLWIYTICIRTFLIWSEFCKPITILIYGQCIREWLVSISKSKSKSKGKRFNINKHYQWFFKILSHIVEEKFSKVKMKIDSKLSKTKLILSFTCIQLLQPMAMFSLKIQNYNCLPEIKIKKWTYIVSRYTNI